ncbi:MAG: uncharacterized SAM-binding protein YcdF (DUF218 family) [Alphaproteobacteria bacterium]|jgi:uncharacterized SAM-binding protein YcdF (DUF218 family)
MLDYIAHVLISPLNQCLLGVVLGLAMLKFSSIARWVGKFVCIISLLWFFLCSQFFFSYWLIAPLENAFPAVQVTNEKWQKADAIWVLACYHFEAERLPRVSRFNHCSIERLVHAANMYRIKAVPIYLTGSDFNKNSSLQYARQAAMFLAELGVAQEDIKIMNKGTNTAAESAQISAAINLLDAPQTLAVVSSATHGTRLSRMLEKNNINYIFIPVHYATKGDIEYRLNMPSNFALARSQRAFYEYAALVKYWLAN